MAAFASVCFVLASCRSIVPPAPVNGPSPDRPAVSAEDSASDASGAGKEDAKKEKPDSVKAEGKASKPDSSGAGEKKDAGARDAAQPPAIPPDELRAGQDSVVAPPGEAYEANSVHRLLMGNLNRDLWSVAFKAPILDLDSVGGGLTPVELTGGRQTLGLEFKGRDGLDYQFRSVVKDASRALPPLIRSGPLDAAVQDQMAAQYPLGAALVAEFLEAAGVLVARPRVIIMPDDPRLGEFREMFAGRMGWIEARPNERDDDKRGFAGSRHIVATDRLFELLMEEPGAQINIDEFVRARIIDMFVNDWDRHADNWRWAGFGDDGRERFDPVPRDRDWAFARVDGLVPLVVGIFYPEYVGFDKDYPSIARLMRVGSQLDRRLLGGTSRDTYVNEAAALQQVFSDSVIDRAIALLPPEYLETEGERLRSALRARRDALGRVTATYYDLLAEWVDAYGTTESDSVAIVGYADSISVSLHRGPQRVPGFTRTFYKSETREVRIYLEDGEDVVTVSGRRQLPFRIRLVGQPGRVAVSGVDSSFRPEVEGAVNGFGNLSFHETGAEAWRGAQQEEVREPPQPEENPTDPVVLARDHRDWGWQWLASPAVDYQSSFGPELGMRITRYGFGFRQRPYKSLFESDLLFGVGKFRVRSETRYEYRFNLEGLAALAHLDLYSSRSSRYYGEGNGTTNAVGDDYFTGFRDFAGLDLSMAWVPQDAFWSAWIGPRFAHWGGMESMDRPLIFDSASVYGSESFSEIGIQAGAQMDTRDDIDHPRGGFLAAIDGRAFPKALGLRAAHAGIHAVVQSYHPIPFALDPVLHLRVYGERVLGDPPFPDRASLGGRLSMPGYRGDRFSGDLATSASALLRFTMLKLGAMGGIGLGGFGLASAGRVWLDNTADVGGFHYGMGGGAFARIDALGRTIFGSIVHGENNTRFYLGFGFPF